MDYNLDPNSVALFPILQLNAWNLATFSYAILLIIKIPFEQGVIFFLMIPLFLIAINSILFHSYFSMLKYRVLIEPV